jgi:hypothetical protein
MLETKGIKKTVPESLRVSFSLYETSVNTQIKKGRHKVIKKEIWTEILI